MCIYTTAGLAVAAVNFRQARAIVRPYGVAVGVYDYKRGFEYCIAHTFYYSSMRRIGATIPAVLLQLSPFATLVLSVPIMGERMNLWQWVSGVVLVAGSILAIWAQEHLGKNTN